MKWNVWACPESANEACLVVAEFDTEAEAEETADRRSLAAERLGVSTTFVHLPEGEEPVF